MSTRPTEPPGGQDDPPDVRTAVIATMRLLHDVRQHLERTRDNDGADDLLLRVVAVHSALERLRRKLNAGAQP